MRHDAETTHLRAPDQDLARRAKRGEGAACHDMVDRYSASLYRLAVGLVGNAADAEDVLQETFAGAFKALDRFEGRSSLRTWLTRILVRQAARHHRTRSRHRTVSLEAVAETEAGPGRGSRSGDTESDARMDVMAALDRLAPIHREVVVLRELQGMSYREIADVLDVPRGTVESRLFRARRMLKERLKDYLT